MFRMVFSEQRMRGLVDNATSKGVSGNFSKSVRVRPAAVAGIALQKETI